jgi:hypothetical protein
MAAPRPRLPPVMRVTGVEDVEGRGVMEGSV